MDYKILQETTTSSDRRLIADFLKLRSQKLLMFITAILTTHIRLNYESIEDKKLIIKTITDKLYQEITREITMKKCNFCEKEFPVYKDSPNPENLCPACMFPEIQN